MNKRLEFDSDCSGERELEIALSIDTLGCQGWEVVQVQEYRSVLSRKYVYYFKKEFMNAEKKETNKKG